MGRALLAALLLLCGCSYAARSAAGHARLIWTRRPLPEGPALAARRYAVEVVGLADGRDYRTWSPVPGDAVTYLVYACPKDSLEPRRFWFPFIGSFPYKGHFKKAHADAEAAKLARKGFDTAVVPVAAYNTPLPWGDPLPSPVLEWSAGDLSELVIHELVHGTVWYRGHAGFNEAVASWVAECAVEGLLAGAALDDWRKGRDLGEARAKLVEELAEKLKAVYASGGEREPVFAWAREEAAKRGVRLREPLNNAVVASYATYRGEPALFDALREVHGRDWRKTLAALKSLDRKDPWRDLRSRVKIGP
ncbi:MAG: aminopeptidase [Elusimicrobiota bacterium]|nr:aminopeptidase [Elusimicrobiota bacterium]